MKVVIHKDLINLILFRKAYTSKIWIYIAHKVSERKLVCLFSSKQIVRFHFDVYSSWISVKRTIKAHRYLRFQDSLNHRAPFQQNRAVSWLTLRKSKRLKLRSSWKRTRTHHSPQNFEINKTGAILWKKTLFIFHLITYSNHALHPFDHIISFVN